MPSSDARCLHTDTSKLDCYDRPLRSKEEEDRDENIGWLLTFITVAVLVILCNI